MPVHGHSGAVSAHGQRRTGLQGLFHQKIPESADRRQSGFAAGGVPPEVCRIILAHELGHAALHSKLTDMRAFHDFAPFDQTSVYEYEANLFAAEFLMDDEDVLSLLNEDCSFFDAARMLRMPPELLDFKFRVLKRKGYALNPPLYARSDFLKEMPASAGRPGESAISR